MTVHLKKNSMKNLLLLLTLTATIFQSNAQTCGQLISSGIVPVNPNSSQQQWVNLQAYCNVGYYLNTYNINQVGSTFYIDAYYCENMLQVISYTNDSIPLGTLPQGSYACFVNVYSSADGCTTYGQTDQAALNWDVNDCSFAVSLQPQDQIVSTGGTATFTSDAIGAIAYQWQTDNIGGSWVNLIDDLTYSGTSTSTLTVSNAQMSINGAAFRLVLTGPGNLCSDSSSAAFLTVNAVSSIDEQLAMDWALYPNPAQDLVILEGIFPEDASAVLLDIYGKVILHEKLNAQTHSIQLPAHISTGSYFMRIQSENGNVLGTKRMIKE